MSYIQDIRNLEHHHVLLGGLFFAATLAPGFLIIFHFKPELIERYDFFKLMLFSLSLTVPYVLFHGFLIHALEALGKKEPGDELAGMAIACMSAIGVLFGSLLLAYSFQKPYRTFLIYAGFLTLVAIIIYWFAAREERQKTDASAP